ncbi:(Fe-S)-binding protein [Desulfobaculum sp.]
MKTSTLPSSTTGACQAQCIQCGRCLEACPLVAATGREELGPRGKMLLLDRLAEAPETLTEKDAARLAGMCLTCGRCARACPQDVDVPAAVARVRAAHPGFARWLWKAWVGSARLTWPAAGGLGALLGRGESPRQGQVGRAVDRLAAMGTTGAVTPWIVPETPPACAPGDKAVLFPGCLAASVRRSWTATAEKLLRFAGVDAAHMPRWDCCGATLGHAGLPDAMQAARRRNVSQWRKAGRPLVVTFCASCHAGLAAYAADASLFDSEDEARNFSGAVTPLSALLAGAVFRETDDAPRRVAYHRPCHAPQDDPDAALLGAVTDGRLHRPDRPQCCGMGGVLQLAAPDLSATVADACWQDLAGEAPATVLTGCSGCVTQLAASAPDGVDVIHWLDAVTFRQ